jgi:ribonuclease HII
MVVAGIDEVGRGCWAGPVVAGAVILDQPIVGLRDSKKLSTSARERLSHQIITDALSYGIGWVTPQDVDSLGLTRAVSLAMHRALEQLTIVYDELIVDGTYNYFPENLKARAVVKADDSVDCVSAASIIAKVARDDYMRDHAFDYPEYGFDKHVGYGTRHHIAMLKLHGVTPLHRLSYKPIKGFVANHS